jgi:hypothetical protein
MTYQKFKTGKKSIDDLNFVHVVCKIKHVLREINVLFIRVVLNNSDYLLSTLVLRLSL